MTIKIEIEIDGQQCLLTEDEARKLHSTLNALFGRREPIVVPGYPQSSPYCQPETLISWPNREQQEYSAVSAAFGKMFFDKFEGKCEPAWTFHENGRISKVPCGADHQKPLKQ